MDAGFSLRPVSFSDLPGWPEDNPSAVIRALQRCRDHVRDVKPYKTGSLGLSSHDLLPALNAAGGYCETTAGAARAFFETAFTPFRIVSSTGAPGFVTAFYEPDVAVAVKPDTVYRYPFYARPDDLVDLDAGNRPAAMDASYVFGRLQEGEIGEYPDRRAIDEGILDGRGLEIAWARSKVDVFFAHVQGAARLVFPDGSVRRITYAAKTGQPFSAIGRLLIDTGRIDPLTVSMGTIRAFLEANPDAVDSILWHNRSYIFFRDASVDDPALGPIAAAKVPLEPGRSLAVDRLIHTFGIPFFIHSETLTHLDQGKPFRRLMLALDTGSAIVGPQRGDIFTGSGDEAGNLAGGVRNAADFFILVPRGAALRYGDHGQG